MTDNDLTGKAVRVGLSTIVAVLLAAPVDALEVEEGVALAKFTRGMVTLQQGGDSCSLADALFLDDSLKAELGELGVEALKRVFTDMGPGDTWTLTQWGDTLNIVSRLDWYRLYFAGETDAVCQAIQQLNGVLWAVPNAVAGADWPDDTYYVQNRQWALKNAAMPGTDLHMSDAWEICRGSNEIRVAVVDDGVQCDHIDFGGAAYPNPKFPIGWDFTNNDPDPTPDVGKDHGTCCAGIISAISNNNAEGVASIGGGDGTIGSGTAVVPLRTQEVDEKIQAINWLMRHMVSDDIPISSNSWWSPAGEVEPLREAITDAWAAGLIQVGSAGNYGPPPHPPTNYTQFPSSYHHAFIRVGAVDIDGSHVEKDQPPSYPDWGSCWGRYLDVVAPTFTATTSNVGYVDEFSGTSCAAPHAAGVLASALALYRRDPSRQPMGPEQAEAYISYSGRKYPAWEEKVGYGLLDAHRMYAFLEGPRRCISGAAASGGVANPDDVSLRIDGLEYERHYVEADVSFPLRYSAPPAVWGAARATGLGACPWPGTAGQLSSQQYRYTEVVPGSVTTEGCRLRAYVFKRGETWSPCEPGQLTLGYCADGQLAFAGMSGFELTEPPAYANKVELSAGVMGADAQECEQENGVEPKTGTRMFRVGGTDVSTSTSYVSWKLFDYNQPLPATCYLSYWIYVESSPGGHGHITLDGLTESGTSLRDWTKWGVIIDTDGQRIHPSAHTVPQGQWVRCIFSLNPAAGLPTDPEVLKSLSVMYHDGGPAETGEFLAYIDDVEITQTFPEPGVWYAETFATGIDENFELGISHTDYQGNAIANGARIIVNGHGPDGEGGQWISPSPALRMRLAAPVSAVSNSWVMWRQYDTEHALFLALLIDDGFSPQWLYYSKNGANHWGEVGWVDMGNPNQQYNVWQQFSRNVYEDYLAEYGVPPQQVLEARIGHFCFEDWDGDKGGIVADVQFTPSAMVGSFERMTAYSNAPRFVSNGGRLHMLYTGKGDEGSTAAFYSQSTDALHWSTPVRVNRADNEFKETKFAALAAWNYRDQTGMHREAYAFWSWKWPEQDYLNLAYSVSKSVDGGPWSEDFRFENFKGGWVEEQLGQPPALLVRENDMYMVFKDNQHSLCYRHYHRAQAGAAWTHVSSDEFWLCREDTSVTRPSISLDSQGRVVVTYLWRVTDGKRAFLRYKDASGWSDTIRVSRPGHTPRTLMSTCVGETLFIAMHEVAGEAHHAVLRQALPPYANPVTVADFPVVVDLLADAVSVYVAGNRSLVYNSYVYEQGAYRPFCSLQQGGVWQPQFELDASGRDSRYATAAVHWYPAWPEPRLAVANTEKVGDGAYVVHTKLLTLPQGPVPPGRLEVIAGPNGRSDVPLGLMRLDPLGPADSLRLLQVKYQGDSIVDYDSTAWFWRSTGMPDTCWPFLYGEGEYRVLAQHMTSDGQCSPYYPATFDTIVFDSVAPGCEVTVNNGERFVNQPQVSVETTPLDSTDVPFEMRFANGGIGNIVANPTFLEQQYGSWEFSDGGYGSGLEMGEVVLSQEHETWVRQAIPCGAFPVGHLGRQYRLSADLLGLGKNYWGQLGWLEFAYAYAHADTSQHDTLLQYLASVQLNGPMEARVGLNRASCDFTLPEPNPDPNLVWQGGIVRLRCPTLPQGASGEVWLDNCTVSPFGELPQTSWWQSFQPGCNWQLDPLVTGEHPVSVAYRDMAGNETWPAYEDTVVLDMQPPLVYLQSPPAGYYLSDTASLAGWAFDWPSPAGDTYFLSYRLDFRYPDSTNWQPVDPDSVSYVAAWPDTQSQGWLPRHLGYWNTTLVPDGPYLLRVVGTDSALNQSEYVTWAYVQNDTGTDDCASTSSSATNMGPGSVYLGTATGKLVHYSEDLDSLGCITISDSLGDANITAMLSVGDDSVLAADAKNLCIHKLRKNGQGKRRFANYPGLIAAAAKDDNGNIWAIDQSRSLLAKVRSNGTLAFTRGGQGADSIERLKNPEGMAVSGELVYVSDTRNNRLVVWDTAGNFTRAIPLGFMPQAILVTDSGAIYTVNKTAGTIVGLNAQGEQFYRIEKRNSNPHKHLVLSEDQHYLFTYQPATKELLKYQIQSNESMPGGPMSGGETSLQPMLHACRPNPFSQRTLISYQFPTTGRVVLRVYDASGRVVKTLENGVQERGSYAVSWDGRDDKGRTVSNGVYFYRVDAPGLKDTKKAVVTK